MGGGGGRGIGCERLGVRRVEVIVTVGTFWFSGIERDWMNG